MTIGQLFLLIWMTFVAWVTSQAATALTGGTDLAATIVILFLVHAILLIAGWERKDRPDVGIRAEKIEGTRRVSGIVLTLVCGSVLSLALFPSIWFTVFAASTVMLAFGRFRRFRRWMKAGCPVEISSSEAVKVKVEVYYPYHRPARKSPTPQERVTIDV